MWPSQREENNNKPNSKNVSGVSCSPSKPVSTTCSPTSHFSPSSSATAAPNNQSTRKAMEEVWKDINLASLRDQATTILTSDSNSNNNSRRVFPADVILQDFLSRPPFNKDKRQRSVSSAEPSSVVDLNSNFFSSLGQPRGTLLSLNSESDFQFLESGVALRQNNNPRLHSHISVSAPSLDASFDGFGSSSLIFPSIFKKRSQESSNVDDSGGDRRRKRMIKNRESAARSRARKQAYTNELELEVAHLLEENAKLRRQQEKLLAAPVRLPRKHTLYRTSTAPF